MRYLFIAVLAALTLLIVPVVLAMMNPEGAVHTTPTDAASTTSTAKFKVFNTSGELIGPLELPRVELTDDQWRERLTDEEFRILRKSGTERAFCGNLLDNKLNGVYTCAGCNLPLFSSDSKFKSGTGWPSFFQPVAKENILEHEDRSYGMVRTEITCARCDGHLGHVFNDGPKPTGLRYCLNSEALNFTESNDTADLAEIDQVVFAGGCFWCVEAVFEELDGVHDVESGYTGGQGTPSYKEVTSGRTGHAEAVRITYNPKRISYEDLLKVHFATHDPTTLNRQGADVGTQYRSAIFVEREDQQKIVEAFIQDLNDQKVFPNPIVTTIEPLNTFHMAEPYHQDYVCNNPGNSYVRAVALPKVEKVRKQFKDKLKDADAKQ